MKTNFVNFNYGQLVKISKNYNFIVTDNKVAKLFPELLSDDQVIYVVKNPENEKNMETIQNICDYFIEKGIKRDSKILAIGGGCISDMAGFVACIILRGVAFDIMPTTLLSMVDASVGGKVGVNSKFGKNLIGAFHFPQNVYLCTDFLKTLSDGEIKSGRGEILKYGMLTNQVSEKIIHKSDKIDLIKECIHFKTQLVEKDPFDQKERLILNLGHTLGHAIEKLKKIPHGMAVAWGIEIMLNVFGHSPDQLLFKSLKQHLEMDWPIYWGIEKDDFWLMVEKDKKTLEDGSIIIILPGKTIADMRKKINFEEFKNKVNSNELFSSYFL